MVVNYASTHKVVAIDSNPKTISMLQHGKCPSTETGVADELSKVSKNIYPSVSYNPVKDTRVTVIMLPSPSDEHDKFVSTYVEAACISLRDVFRRDDKPHTVIVSSTLMPGTMDKTILPIFSDCPKVNLCYSPVFVALGGVLNGLRKPDSIIIGEQNEEAGEIAESLLNTSTYGTPDVVRTNFINAELAKLLLNCFITAKISLANSCADICERFDNADANVVLSFLGKDKRIGSKTIMPGLGYGGKCFPRDSKALIALGRDIKLPNIIQQSIGVFNDKHDDSVVTKVVKIVSTIKNPVVGVLGLTYKTDVDLVDDSNALKIAERIGCCGIVVKVYDPKGMEAAKTHIPMSRNFIYCDSMQECINDTDLVLLATPWKEFSSPDFSTMRHKQVLDCWRLWDKKSLESKGIKYYAVGLG